MDIKRTKRLMKFCMLSKVPAVLVGHSGVGKSAVVEETGKEVLPSHTITKLMASQVDIGDLIGIPYLKDIKFAQTASGVPEIRSIELQDGSKITSWARPEWMPYEPVVLFLDEVNQASKDVESALFQLVYEKRIHNHHLHPDSTIIAAINPSTSEYTTANVMSAAFVKRFVVIPFQPTADEIIEFGHRSGAFHTNILSYMEFQKADIGVDKPLDLSIKIEPCPRTLEMASKIFKAAEKDSPANIKDTDIVADILSTTIGTSAAAGYIKWMESQLKPMDFNEIVNAWKKGGEAKFLSFREQGREDLVSQTVTNVFDGILNYSQSFGDKVRYTNYVNDVDSEDKETGATALKEFKTSVENYDKASISNIMAFLRLLPKDIFYQFTYNLITHGVIDENMSPEVASARTNAHFTMILYLFSKTLKGHANLSDRVSGESEDIAAFIKKKHENT